MSTLPSSDPGARVLAVDLDDLTMERLRTAVRGTEIGVACASPEEAVGLLRTAREPVIVLLEWAAEHEEDLERLCLALRGASRPARCRILALGGLSGQSSLLRAADGAVDDVLSRPFSNDLLLVRIRQALRSLPSANVPVTPREALEEALSRPGGGEVVIRSGDVAAWIHVQDGHIVWANVSSAPATMDEVTRHGGLVLEADTMAAVKEESRSTGAHFMEVLVRWGLISEDRAREAVRAFVAERVKIALELPDAAGLFLPKVRAHSGRLRFRASEIPSLRDPRQSPPGARRLEDGLSFDSGLGPPLSARTPPLPLLSIARVVGEASALEAALGAAVLDRGSGACLHHEGTEIDTEVAWAQMGALAALGPDAEEVLASAGGRLFVARPLRAAPSLVLFVALSLSSTTLGMARASIARLASKGAESRPPAEGEPEAPLRREAVASTPRAAPAASQDVTPDEGPERRVAARAGEGTG